MTATLHETGTPDKQVPEQPFFGESIEFDWIPRTASEESLRTLGHALRSQPSLQAQAHSHFTIDRTTSECLKYSAPLGCVSRHHMDFVVFDVSIHDAKFKDLAQAWKAGTWHMSSIRDMIEHPAYQAIIRMGNPAVPLLLEDLKTELTHWFIALSEITGADPVPPEDAGIVERMRDAWLSWGRKNNYI